MVSPPVGGVSPSGSEDSVRKREDREEKDSAIDLGRDLEELTKLQMVLDQMSECPRSPSTSIASSSRENDKALALAARRLIRVPCYANKPSPFTIQGGAALARLISVDVIRQNDLIGILAPGDILLSVEDLLVSGMLRSTVQNLIDELCRTKDQIAIKVLPKDSIPNDLCELLADSTWADLQVVIRDNVYAKTVPFTTRPPREGEVDGEHYRFVSTEEFNRLKSTGQLLEHGSYQEHLYGTPRPVEMVTGATKGPLPPNWEVSYDENGEKYYIDHNNGVTQWDDPRELPEGWEQVDDPVYGTFFVDHVNKRTTYDRPGTSSGTLQNGHNVAVTPSTVGTKPFGYQNNGGMPTASPARQSRRDLSTVGSSRNPQFTNDPSQLRGELFNTRMVKGPKGLGFTLIGNDSSSRGDEFIQVKSVIPGGAAAANGVLNPGDVLVKVNGECLLGASQADACRIFVAIPVGDNVDIQVCRGYPLVLDPANRIITENVYDHRPKDYLEIEIAKGSDGFGFTIADSGTGQRVKKILYPAQCPNLLEGDVICELDGRNVRGTPHTQLVDMLRDCHIGYRGRLTVQRSSPKQRSRTPTAAFRYGGERATPAPSVAPRSKTPAPVTRTPGDGTETYGRSATMTRQPIAPPPMNTTQTDSRLRPSSTSLGFNSTPNYMPLSAFQKDTNNLIIVNLIRKPHGFGFRLLGGSETGTLLTVGQIVPDGAAANDGRLREGDEIVEIDAQRVEGASHSEAVSLLERAAHNKHVKLIVRRPNQQNDMARSSSLPSSEHRMSQSIHQTTPLNTLPVEYDVIVHRQADEGFGFVIISSMTRSGSKIGQIIEGSPAERCGRLNVEDRVTAVNGIDITNMSHGDIVGLIKASGLSVQLTISPESTISPSHINGTMSRSAYAPSYSHPAPTYGGYGTVQHSPASYFPPPPPQVTNYSPKFAQRQNGYGAKYESFAGPREVTPDQEEIMSVELQRGSRGFGFSIRGGQEFGAMPLFVLRIAEDGPAAADGRLKVGDQLIAINGTDTRGLTHEQAINLIKQHPTVQLSIRRHRLP